MRLRILPTELNEPAMQLPRSAPRTERARHRPQPPVRRRELRYRPSRPDQGEARAVGARSAGQTGTAVTTHRPPTLDLQRTVVKSGCIGALVSVTAVTAVVAVNGGGVGSIGAGIMVAGFDGFPFGAMIGAMVHFMRHPEEQ